MESNQESILKIVLLGDDNTGKTTFATRFKTGLYKPPLTTSIGVDFTFKHISLERRNIKAQIWDTVGQEGFRKISFLYCTNAHGIILFFDVSCRSSFLSLPSIIKSVKNYNNQNAEILIIGNKCDLENRQVGTDEANAFAENNNLKYMEASSKNGTNINESIEYFAQKFINEQMTNSSNDIVDKFTIDENSDGLPLESFD